MHADVERMIADIRFETQDSQDLTDISAIAPQIVEALR